MWCGVVTEKGADCTYVEAASSASLLLRASLLGQAQVTAALLQCLARPPTGSSSASSSAGQATADSKLTILLRLGNEELITPLTAAVAEGHEDVVMVRRPLGAAAADDDREEKEEEEGGCCWHVPLPHLCVH